MKAPTRPSQLPIMLPRWDWMSPRIAANSPRLTVTIVTTDNMWMKLNSPGFSSLIQNDVNDT